MSLVLPWLVVAALVVTLVAIVYAVIKQRKETNNEIKRLTSELEAQKKNNEEMCFYVEEVARQNRDKDKVSKQITEAKNDEEVMSIIAGLVHANNDRVRK